MKERRTDAGPRTGPNARPSEPAAAVKGEVPRSAEDSWIMNRWLAPILDLPELRHQVRRGKILARKSVRNLTIRPGLIAAEVSSDSGESHSVKVRMDPIDGPTWVAVVEAISEEAALAADLIRGRMSERLAEIFEEAGHDLFPFDLRDVASYCSCREDSKVCTGAVATHIHFAEVIQADPMKLFTFRGRDQAWLAAEVRERRGGAAPVARQTPQTEVGRKEAAAARAANGRSEGHGEVFEPATSLRDGFWQKDDQLPVLTFHIEREPLGEEEAFPVVRALGPAPGDTPPEEVATALYPVLRTLQLKLERIQDRAELESETPPPDLEVVPEVEPLDEVLLAAARRQGQLTTTMVAQALGVSTREAREYLQYLVSAGKLVVQGKARGTRYVPADKGPGDDAVAPVATDTPARLPDTDER